MFDRNFFCLYLMVQMMMMDLKNIVFLVIFSMKYLEKKIIENKVWQEFNLEYHGYRFPHEHAIKTRITL